MTWSFQSYLDQPDQLIMNDLHFVNSLNGWAFGSMFYFGILTDAIFRTTNGGNSWYLETIHASGSPVDNFVVTATMFNDHKGWAVCGDGSVLKYQLITSVVERLSEQQPKTFTLKQNYPNPFNPSTTIEYELLKRQTVTHIITDALGKRVETVLNDEQQEAGMYRLRFDGRSLSSGTYFYTIQTESFTDTKQMTIVK